jgi:hypothetical protein
VLAGVVVVGTSVSSSILPKFATVSASVVR